MRGGKSALIWLAVTAVVLLFAMQQFSLAGYVSSDFEIFHAAAVRFGRDPAAIYQGSWTGEMVADARSLQGFLYPPPSIIAFWPLGLIGKASAFALFSWAALAAAVASCWFWLRLIERERLAAVTALERTVLIGLACATGPVFANRGGQVDTFVLLLCVLGMAWGAGRMRWLGGVALAIGGWIKIYPGLLLLYWIATGRARHLLGGFVAAALAIPLLALLVMPVSVFPLYFGTLLPAMSGRAIINIDNQSLHAVWLRLAHTHIDARTSFAAFDVPPIVGVGIALVAFGTIAGFASRCRRTGGPMLPLAAVTMAWIGLLAPLGWGHSYAYGLPLLLLVLAMTWQRSEWRALLAGLGAWAAIVIPAHRRLGDAVPDLIAQIFYARYALAVLLLMLLAWRLIGCAALKPSADPPI